HCVNSWRSVLTRTGLDDTLLVVDPVDQPSHCPPRYTDDQQQASNLILDPVLAGTSPRACKEQAEAHAEDRDDRWRTERTRFRLVAAQNQQGHIDYREDAEQQQ